MYVRGKYVNARACSSVWWLYIAKYVKTDTIDGINVGNERLNEVTRAGSLGRLSLPISDYRSSLGTMVQIIKRRPDISTRDIQLLTLAVSYSQEMEMILNYEFVLLARIDSDE